MTKLSISAQSQLFKAQRCRLEAILYLFKHFGREEHRMFCQLISYSGARLTYYLWCAAQHHLQQLS